MKISDVLAILSKNKLGRDYPGASDPRYTEGIIIPKFYPKFGIDFANSKSVFTIGSCFARNIEEVLEPMGVSLPTRKFYAPKEEWHARPNGLLNEFNPGSIGQKILSTLKNERPSEVTIFKHGNSFHDLLLPGGSGVSYERAVNRRNEIYDVYKHLIYSEIVIITLGHVEAWFCNHAKQFLNRMPPNSHDVDPSRFTFKRLDVDEVMRLLTEPLTALSLKNKKIILTISPVPIATTMTNMDCLLANEFSKSVLRVCAERLRDQIKNVDYYPSYEIVRTAGLISFEKDNRHVKHSAVKKITDYMVERYQETFNQTST